MRNDTPLTLIGNLTEDPELRYTGNGIPVARFTVASTPRIRDGQGNWSDGEATFMTCTVWRKLAENTVESFRRGSRVIVVGRLSTQRWETEEGEKRSRVVMEVDDVGPSIAFNAARELRPERSNGGRQNSEPDPWASEPPAETSSPAESSSPADQGTGTAAIAESAVKPAKKAAAKKATTRASKASE
jgi:single-strand DNA-binding protein